MLFNKKKILLPLAASLLLLLPLYGFSQNFPILKFRHLTVSNGLPSDKIAFTFVDSKNLIWIATTSSLVRYDGLHYKVFEEKKANNTGFYGRNISKIIEDSAGNLYIGTESGINKYIRQTGIIEHIFYTQKKNEGAEFMVPHYIDQKSNLWVFNSDERKLFMYDLNTRKFEEKSTEWMERMVPYPSALYQPLSFAVCASNLEGIAVYKYNNGFQEKPKKYFVSEDNRYPKAIFNHRIYIENSENIWLPANLGLINFNSVTEKYQLYNSFNNKKIGPVSCVVKFNEQYLLVGTEQNGFFIFDRHSNLFVENFYHLDADPTSIISNKIQDIKCDNQKNIFISYVGKGIDITSLPDPSLQYGISRQATALFNTTNSIKSICRITDSTFWVINENNKILQWNSENNKTTQPELLKKINEIGNNSISQIYKDKKNDIWIIGDNQLYHQWFGKNVFEKIKVEGTGKNILFIEQNKYMLTTAKSLFLLNYLNNEWKINEITDLKENSLSINSSLHIDSLTGYIYVLSEWGEVISELKPHNNSYQLSRHSEWNVVVSEKSYAYNDMNFILLPGADGLFKLDKNSFLFEKISGSEILNNELGPMIRFNDSIFYVISANSIYKIKYPGWTSTIEYLPIAEAIKNEIQYTSIYSDDGKFIYFLTNDGIITYNTLKKIIRPQPELYLSVVVMDDKSDTLYKAVEYADNIVVPSNVNSLNLFISNLNFSNQNSLRDIQYQLIDYDNTSQEVSANGKIHFNKLSPGEYHLHFFNKANNQLLKKITLIVRPKWYQTWLFKSLLLICALAIAYAIIKYRTNQIRKTAQLKADYENKMLHLEMQNLRSQMNPHFIFNSLNSINSFVVENKTHLAADYLTKFSRLMRLILENSKNESIDLEKELETLNLYFLMERIRFDKKFDCSVNVEPGIDTQLIKVPPMIIQPYAENAIWHGLLQKEEKGKLEVNIKRSLHKSLLIEIIDNGVGRSKAAELKSKESISNKSYGMQITEQRIKQLNHQNSIEIIDLKDSHGNARGTKINILIFLD
jgi:ligand-binding sensor domain-containing protein